MSDVVFRLHPTINLARVGTSDEYYLSPETSAGLPGAGDTVGGLPIKTGTEDEPITSDDLRDARGHLRRQAARFRIFAYDFTPPDRYPGGGGVEITAGSTLPDGRVVKDVVWTVHLANKKANAYMVVPSEGLAAYCGKVPQLRNPSVYGDVDAPGRLAQLVIDPGPRAITSRAGGVVAFDAATGASYSDGRGGISEQPQYPKSFPGSPLFEPSGPLETLGELTTDHAGRLLVLAGRGRTAAQYDEYGDPIPCTGDLNNSGWFDDAADGPVSATIVFEDGSAEEAFGAWVICGDPAYAPQIRNVVSVWDDVYDAWVRRLDLQPEIFRDGAFDEAYRPSFAADVHPIFRAAALQRWTANLPELAVRAHEAVDAIAASDDPDATIMTGLAYVRNPNVVDELSVGVPLMPLSLGEAGTDFLAVSKTQYFFLEQWSRNHFDPEAETRLGPGEYLDMASLSNCLGGRYVPGIEISYPIREPDMYQRDWRSSGAGPFRVKHKPLDYAAAVLTTPFLSGGWIPLHGMTGGLEPGDMSKFMSIPWQTDYNSCSIHQPSINTSGENTATGNPLTLYWSWPSQRPDAVYPATEVVNGVLPPRVWSVRGPGTLTSDPKSAATFQTALQSITQWDRIGIVLQGTAISGGEYPPEYFLEAASLLPTQGQAVNVVAEWAVQREPILIIGAGPAGLATAIELRGLDVTVVEAGDEPAERFGESVPPDIVLALDRLGVSDAFRADGHCPCPGTISLWGSDRPGHNDSILNPLGPAWHLSRARFEAMLRRRAVESGTTLRTRCRAVAVEGGSVVTQDGDALPARWVVDATGPRAWFARRMGATRLTHDRMVAIVRFAALRSGTFTAQTVVEATPDGWWYGAALPDARIVTVLMASRHEARALTDDGHAGWRASLAATQELAPRLDACELAGERFHSAPVTSSILDRVEGDRWLAVGDAASTYDPIAAQGIYKALADAADAARTITTGATNYSERVLARFNDYLANRAHLYGLEPRWPDRPFWRERELP